MSMCGYRVKKDMDEVGGKLMGAHGYCTQVLMPSSLPFIVCMYSQLLTLKTHAPRQVHNCTLLFPSYSIHAPQATCLRCACHQTFSSSSLVYWRCFVCQGIGRYSFWCTKINVLLSFFPSLWSLTNEFCNVGQFHHDCLFDSDECLSWTVINDCVWQWWVTVFDSDEWLCLTAMSSCLWQWWVTVFDSNKWLSLTAMSDCLWQRWVTVFDSNEWLCLTTMSGCFWQLWVFPVWLFDRDECYLCDCLTGMSVACVTVWQLWVLPVWLFDRDECCLCDCLTGMSVACVTVTAVSVACVTVFDSDECCLCDCIWQRWVLPVWLFDRDECCMCDCDSGECCLCDCVWQRWVLPVCRSLWTCCWRARLYPMCSMMSWSWTPGLVTAWC